MEHFVRQNAVKEPLGKIIEEEGEKVDQYQVSLSSKYQIYFVHVGSMSSTTDHL